MKNRFIKKTCILMTSGLMLIAAASLYGCSSSSSADKTTAAAQSTEKPAESENKTTEAVQTTAEQTTEAVTEAPTTAEPETEAPTTEEPATEADTEAVVTEDVPDEDATEVGEGEKNFYFVADFADGNSNTYCVHTDEDTVGAALLALGIIAGDDSDWGLYVKEVDGVVADYDVDKSYWAFYINGEYAMTGVDATDIEEGATYTFRIEK